MFQREEQYTHWPEEQESLENQGTASRTQCDWTGVEGGEGREGHDKWTEAY